MYELLEVESRDLGGKNSGRWRKEGYVTGVLYGLGADSNPIKMNIGKIQKCLSQGASVFEVEVKGDQKYLVNLAEVQRDPTTRQLVHVSFKKLSRNAETTILLPIHFTGESIGAKAGGTDIHSMDKVHVTGLPKDMPEFYEVDVSALEIGSNLHLSDLIPPKGLKFSENELDHVVVSCAAPKAEAETEANPDEVATTKEDATGSGNSTGEVA